MKIIKKNRLVIRFLIYILSFFVLSMGMTVVIHSAIGYSPTDMFVMSINNLFDKDMYSLLLTFTNFFMYFLTLILYLFQIKRKLKIKTKSDIFYYLSQLIPAFLGGPSILLFKKLFVIELHIEEYSYFIRLLFFIIGWMIFCIGTSLIVWVNILMQSYNSVVLDLTKIFNIKFMMARLIIDFSFSIIGLIITLSTNIDKIFEVLNVGTFILTFLSGPLMYKLLEMWKKITVFEKKYKEE